MEINAIEKKIEKINELKSGSLKKKKTSKIDKSLAKHIKKKMESSNQ